jgi:DNA-binding winged helix-turn-helix (wHTH) protein
MSQGISRDLAGFHPRTAVRIRFGPFTLDLASRQLTSAGREIHLEPKAFELLSVLVLERPKALSKADLQERLWPGTFVAEANLSNLVAEIRSALDDPARAPRFVRTAHRFGYAFCGDAVSLTDPGDVAPARLWCRLEANGRQFPLPSGEHVIGRDADVAIRFDTSTVSRRHARVVVTAEAAVLEDCGSKNGTFRGNEQVTSPVALADGDTIRVGSVRLTFHVSSPFGATETHEEAPPWL